MIAQWPVSERPRERLLRQGAEGLTDGELLAVCLRTGSSTLDALAFARELLARYGSLHHLLHAKPEHLLAEPGLGPVKVASLKACLALTGRLEFATLSDASCMEDPQAVSRYLRLHLANLEQEVFGCLFLNSRHRLLGFDKLFFGSIDRAHVHPREILKRALTYNAAAVILAHNHPSGIAEPSSSDIALTHQLQSLLAQIDVRLLDHVVVAGGSSVSFAQRGLL